MESQSRSIVSADDKESSDKSTRVEAETQKLKSSIESMQQSITSTQSQLSSVLSQFRALQNPTRHVSAEEPSESSGTDEETLSQAEATLRSHVKMLQQYNEIRDIALSLMQITAEREGKTFAQVMEEKGLDKDD